MDVPADWVPLKDRNQTYWTTEVFADWFSTIKPYADADTDGHVTFRELLTFWDHPEIETLITRYGENLKWWDDSNGRFGLIYTSLFSSTGSINGGEDLTYEQTYNMIATMTVPIRPWVVDLIYGGELGGSGLKAVQFSHFFHSWMYVEDDTWTSERPADWV